MVKCKALTGLVVKGLMFRLSLDITSISCQQLKLPGKLQLRWKIKLNHHFSTRRHLAVDTIRLKAHSPVSKHLTMPCCHLLVDPWWKGLVHRESAALMLAISAHRHAAKWMEISVMWCTRQPASDDQILQSTPVKRDDSLWQHLL